jgi:transposase InsO family protein
VFSHPTSSWAVQQLREAFPYDSTPGYQIFDRGPQFNNEMNQPLKCFGIQLKRTSFRSPWQNGIAERWVSTCQLDLLDHVFVLDRRHLKRLMNEYVHCYHEDRTHLALAKVTRAGSEAADGTESGCRVLAMPRLGGLHHRYDLAA